MKYSLFAFAILLFSYQGFGQDTTRARVLTGPFASSIDRTSGRVWLAYRGNGAFAVTLRDTATGGIVTPLSLHKLADARGDTALSLDFTGLLPGHTYEVLTGGLRRMLWTPECYFTTVSEVPVRDLDILVGSCALLNTDITRIAFPGGAERIFKPMTNSHADLMIWLGDNIYYLGRQYTSYQRMFARNLRVRMHYHVLDRFLASMPQYTIWDDHDYGPNDADCRFPLKDTSLLVFRNFWINPYEDTVKETFFTYSYYDAQFFMTDDRWWREDKDVSEGSFLGQHQLGWLKAKLLESKATFKFICVGSQVLNEENHGECYAQFPKERNELLDFIAEHNIKGVILLTGDTHYAEMTRQDWKGYPLYDFTSSPITSPMDPKNLTSRNEHRIPGSTFFHKNYGRIKIIGPLGNRTCKLSINDINGKVRWEYAINEGELQRKDKTIDSK